MAARGLENRFERTLLVKALFLDTPASNPYAVLIFRDLEVVSFTVTLFPSDQFKRVGQRQNLKNRFCPRFQWAELASRRCGGCDRIPGI